MDNSNNPIKCIKTLIHSAETRVAEFEIGPQTEGEVHYHSEVSEHCICLRGQLQVTLGADSVCLLKPGEKLEIPAGKTHQIINPGEIPGRYLVVQYGGAYDFITR